MTVGTLVVTPISTAVKSSGLPCRMFCSRNGLFLCGMITIVTSVPHITAQQIRQWVMNLKTATNILVEVIVITCCLLPVRDGREQVIAGHE